MKDDILAGTVLVFGDPEDLRRLVIVSSDPAHDMAYFAPIRKDGQRHQGRHGWSGSLSLVFKTWARDKPQEVTLPAALVARAREAVARPMTTTEAEDACAAHFRIPTCVAICLVHQAVKTGVLARAEPCLVQPPPKS